MAEASGFAAAAVAVLCFGTNFVPVKRIDAGDGVAFQWVMTVAIWLVGLAVQLYRDARVEPLALLGGALWTLGNTLCVPIIRMIGMGLGILVWGGVSMVIGWAIGRFGLFGVDKQTDIHYPTLNSLGAVVCLCSMGIFFFVKPTSAKADADNVAVVPNDADSRANGAAPAHTSVAASAASSSSSSSSFTGDVAKIVTLSSSNAAAANLHFDGEGGSRRKAPHGLRQDFYSALPEDDEGAETGSDRFPQPILIEDEDGDTLAFLERLSPTQRQLLGFSLATVSGSFFGATFVFAQYLHDHPTSFGASHSSPHSSNMIDYVFSHFSGIFATSSAIFVIYSLLRRNRPFISRSMFLPGMLSGLLWGVACVAFFIANDHLSFVVSYPLISSGPGIVASLWGIFLFKEIQGARNFLILAAAICVALVGVSLIVVSKVA